MPIVPIALAGLVGIGFSSIFGFIKNTTEDLINPPQTTKLTMADILPYLVLGAGAYVVYKKVM